MKVWHWFCKLGTKVPAKKVTFFKKRKPQKDNLSGAEICTRLCGHDSCRCGGTMRGLYCVWSYYRE